VKFPGSPDYRILTLPSELTAEENRLGVSLAHEIRYFMPWCHYTVSPQ